MSDLPTRLAELKPSRRTVLVAAAWTAPAVIGLSAAPAVAASGDPTTPPEPACVADTPAFLETREFSLFQGDLTGPGTTDWTASPAGFTSTQAPTVDNTVFFVDYLFNVAAGSRYRLDTVLRSSWTDADKGVQFASVFYLNPSAGTSTDFQFVASHDSGYGTPGGPTDYPVTEKITAGSKTITVRVAFGFTSAGAASYGDFWVMEPTLTCAGVA